MTRFLLGGASALTLAVFSFAVPNTAFASDFTAKVNGRVLLDYTSANIDAPDSSIDDTELRSSRLSVSGNLSKTFKYKVEINKSTGSDVQFEDVYVQFSPKNTKFKIKAGQYKTQNSLDEQTSSRFMSALERSAFTDAFAFDRRVGVSIGRSGKNYTFDAGAFASNLTDSGGTDDGHAFAARGTFNPIKTDDTLVHLGASWRYRSTGDNNSDFRYRQRPYTHVAPNRIVDTGRFAESDNFYGVEAAIISGRLWVAGEYALLDASGSGTHADGDFNGFYAESGIFFGGRRAYKGGKFDRPVVDKPLGEGGYGALSLLVRFDQLDVEDGIYQGKLDTTILGADWYPTKHTRVGVNYFNSDAKNGSADKGEGILARFQFDF